MSEHRYTVGFTSKEWKDAVEFLAFLVTSGTTTLSPLLKKIRDEAVDHMCKGCGELVFSAPHACPGKRGEPTEFSVRLELVEPKARLATIIFVRDLGYGLLEAKNMVEGAPSVLKARVSRYEADELKRGLEAAGAKATIVPHEKTSAARGNF